MVKKVTLSVILYPQKQGGYTAICPELKGCISEGETVDQALKNIRDAMNLFIGDDEYDAEYFEAGFGAPNKLYKELEIEVDFNENTRAN